MNIVISGHYGGINLGDDAILCSLIDTLYTIFGNELSITAFSHNPVLTRKQTSVKSVKQMSFSLSMINELYTMVKTLRLSDCIIIGGGGLLQDEFNIRTIPRYLLPAIIIKLYRKKAVFYGLGVGPLNTLYSKYLIKLISAQVDRIAVRDTESKNIMEQLDIKNVDVVPDPALRLLKCTKERTLQILKQENIEDYPGPKIGISLRGIYHTKISKTQPVKTLSPEQRNNIIQSLEEIAGQLGSLLVFFCTDNVLDKSISEEIAKKCKCDTRFIRATYPPKEYAGILGAMDIVISMPLHSAILACSSHIPVVAIDYNPKVRNFMKLIGLEKFILPIDQLDLLKAKVLQAWNEKEVITNHLLKEIERLKIESITSLQRTLNFESTLGKPRNVPLIIFSAIYMVVGFIPEYFFRKHAKNNTP